MPESFPMNGGDGVYSYSKNSQYQREASNIVKDMIGKVIAEKLDISSLTSASNKFCIADLGCSVGPNTFFAMQNVIEAVEKIHLTRGLATQNLEFQVFFNDHASNDFNTLFTSLPPNRQYFAAGVPGSYYDQRFPRCSLHFVHSSYALSWLSKVPEELLDEKSPARNKDRIIYTSASDEVANAYATQFEKDMERFLDARAKEVVAGGMMVLVIQSLPDGIHRSKHPSGVPFDFLGATLIDMVNEGLINGTQVESFNVPLYFCTPKEMAEAIRKNGCFSIERMEMTDPRPNINAPINVNSSIMTFRAAIESVVTKHFGPELIDELFERISHKSEEISKEMELSNEKGTQLFVVLKRKSYESQMLLASPSG